VVRFRFAILDNSNPNVDYHYIPLIFLESFSAPALVLRVGDVTISLRRLANFNRRKRTRGFRNIAVYEYQ